ncbi:hypothetical protein GWE18_12560 [Bradyrhizobium sp. CSA112]|uniref:hypothetical protein n=1 Tax=Bradyrhizobium sp. CSA112 TaxID=2699170 RepID=UPI0023AE8EBE|nr:hypothetical protein [Bradyrhizobium sp. CSA112]MDE5453680.1 hypothetical protein [Bradyrhizobium sp. CSA112]
MTLLIKTLATIAAGTVLATSAFAQSAREIRGASPFETTPSNQSASVLLWRWPQMKTFIEQAVPGSMFELSINRRTGFVPLAVK